MPVITPTPPSTASSSITVGAAASTAPIPAVGSISGSISLPAATTGAGATIAATSSLNPPASLPALQAHLRAALDTTTVYVYESFTPSATITFASTPTFSITLPAGTNMSQSFFIAVYNAGWDKVHAQAGTVSGLTVTFPSQATSLTLQAGTTYYFALYGVLASTPAPTATPTPAPTATPTPVATATPTPAAIVLSPSSLAFTALGSANAQTVTATETGYTGTFTSSSANCVSGSTTIATLAASASGTQFTVTPVAAGTCSVDINDTSSHHTSLGITVTTTTVGGT
ncbi:MAG: hypothetical protein NVSMB31_02930 [Vulcanimicrobiaceae bacterium]